MIAEKALVLYKNRPALVNGTDDGKITITQLGEKSIIKVREKDVELLHPGPFYPEKQKLPAGDAQSAWELLAGTGEEISIRELAELAWGEYTPESALAAYRLLEENIFFTGGLLHIKAKSGAELEAEEKKRKEKQQETEDYRAFLDRMRGMQKNSAAKEAVVLTDKDRRFLGETEALACGQTDKSRILADLGISETPADAHRLLLKTGVWTVWENPHPGRCGVPLNPVKAIPPIPPEEERLDLTHLPAFAIDNSYSDDPDDALSLEDQEGSLILWVHTADPAASVTPGSPADIEAQNRGSTLYLPERTCRMLAPQSLSWFILKPGAPGDTPALSFRLTLKPDLTIADVQVLLTRIRVTCLTYKDADNIAACETAGGPADGSEKILRRLFCLAEQNLERRLNTGAVNIEMPEVHIKVIKDAEDPKNNRIEIEKIPQYRSAAMVRECMILAGEGAALWAARNRVPFPFISQDAGELPDSILPGLAGAYQIRRSMRPRILSNKPGVHWGLGLDLYTQVTSPLRRYTDLLAHQQIRAFIRGGPMAGDDEILMRVMKAEAGAAAAAKAERASNSHWTAVYLSERIGSVWEGIILGKQGGRSAVIIPDLGIETQVTTGKSEPNGKIMLTCAGVKIPECEVIFAE